MRNTRNVVRLGWARRRLGRSKPPVQYFRRNHAKGVDQGRSRRDGFTVVALGNLAQAIIFSPVVEGKVEKHCGWTLRERQQCRPTAQCWCRFLSIFLEILFMSMLKEDREK